MDDLLKKVEGAAGQSQGAGGLGDVLGGLMGSGGLGSILGAGAGAGVGNAMGGGLGSILGGGMGALIPTLLPAILGMLGKIGPGGQSGMHQLVDTANANGLQDLVGSWVGHGPSQPMSATQVQQVLSPEQLGDLAAKTGLPADQVSQGVAAILPHIVDTLTPNGTLPDHADVQNATNQLQQVLASITGGGHP